MNATDRVESLILELDAFLSEMRQAPIEPDSLRDWLADIILALDDDAPTQPSAPGVERLPRPVTPALDEWRKRHALRPRHPFDALHAAACWEAAALDAHRAGNWGRMERCLEGARVRLFAPTAEAA